MQEYASKNTWILDTSFFFFVHREAGTAALRKDMNTQYITNDHIQSVIVSICERAEDQVLEGRLNVYEKFLHDHSL